MHSSYAVTRGFSYDGATSIFKNNAVFILISKASDWEEWSSELWNIQSISDDGRDNALWSVHEIVQWALSGGLDGWCIPKMNLNWLLEGGKGFIQEVFAMWTEVAGTARVNEGIMAGFTGKEGNDVCHNKDTDVVVIVRREWWLEDRSQRGTFGGNLILATVFFPFFSFELPSSCLFWSRFFIWQSASKWPFFRQCL